MNRNTNTSIQKTVLTGIFVAVLAVLSQFSIPMPSGTPLTLQTFAVALTAYVLGWKLGTAATFVYLLLGAVGVPVFANFYSGIGVLLGMTGGFLWGFLFMAALCGLGMASGSKILLSVLSLLGLGICHLLGVVQFMLVMNMSFPAAFLSVSLPYLLKDVLSVAAAWFAAIAVRQAMRAASLSLT